MRPTADAGGAEQAEEEPTLYCCFVLRGQRRASRVIVVDADEIRSVVAAPAAVASCAEGRWASSPDDSCVQAVFSCRCLQPHHDSACGVVFHVVATDALLERAPPGSLGFATERGDPCEPCPESVLEAHCSAGEAGCNWIPACCAAEGGERAPGEPYYEVRLSEASALFFFDSVLVVPDLLTPEECSILADAADRHLEAGGCWKPQEEAFLGGDVAAVDSLKRVGLCHLGEEANWISETLLWDRVLGLLEGSLPQVAQELFGRSTGLQELTRHFSPGEPAVNRYTAGGEFKKHQDRYSVTVYLLLSKPSAFTGGGTAFWSQEGDGEGEPSVVLRPLQGHAVVFNGDIMHAGWPVVSGVRHLFVASFHLDDEHGLAVPRKWRGGRNGDVELATE